MHIFERKNRVTMGLVCSAFAISCAADDAEPSGVLFVDAELNETDDESVSSSSSALVSSSARGLYRVTLTNLTETQPFTPPVVATHSRRVAFFRSGVPAPRGVREIAENGNNTPLVDALERVRKLSPLVTDFAVGVAGDPPPLMPGASVTVEVDGNPRDRLSIASMLICSNDGFTGIDSVRLPRAIGRTREYLVKGYDAGSERNTEDFADIVPPCQALRGLSSDDAGTGESNPSLAERGVVRVHPGIDGSLPTSDLTVDVHGFSQPVARVTITRIAEYEVTIKNLTNGQPLTPPVIATHKPEISFFTRGETVPEGIREIAENGNNDPLVEALNSSDAVSDVVVALGDPPPVLPGASVTATIRSDLRGAQLSTASMLICTNDGFTSASLRLPRRIGRTRSAFGVGYDAGSERNTEDFADIVPPCQDLIGVTSEDAGTGMSNPDLAENGVVRLHPGIDGSLDTSDLTIADHGWPVREPTVRIDVRRVR